MDMMSTRIKLLVDYDIWANAMISKINVKEQPNIIQASLIDAKYSELRSLQDQFEYSTNKANRAKTIRDEELTTNLSKPILMDLM